MSSKPIFTCNGSYDFFLWNISLSNCSNFSIGVHPNDIVEYSNAVLVVVLSLFSMITIGGNILVMLAVGRERYLRTVTNYFIVSLAIADLVIGAVVMPFSIVLEMTNQVWIFGSDWCDVWHSFDVLASTASILNLSVISLDRYWAITDPIAYPSKMSTGRAFVLIALVWICSAAISFPAILWWRSVSDMAPQAHVCSFTDDTGYLIFSSIISFYVPMSVILFAYYKIYKAATEQIRSLKTGSKVMTGNGCDGEVMTLRMHRGGGHRSHDDEEVRYSRAANSDSDAESSPAHMSRNIDMGSPAHLIRNQQLAHHNQHMAHAQDDDYPRPSRMISRKWKHFALSKKLSKLAKEQKAAKTLGIVMGVFCICWVPFFVTNVLYGICKDDCVIKVEIIFPVFTWLGYINSGMNPIIYACSMRDFRRAFGKILFHCCPRHRFKRRHFDATFSSSSYTMTACTERCVNVRL